MLELGHLNINNPEDKEKILTFLLQSGKSQEPQTLNKPKRTIARRKPSEDNHKFEYDGKYDGGNPENEIDFNTAYQQVIFVLSNSIYFNRWP